MFVTLVSYQLIAEFIIYRLVTNADRESSSSVIYPFYYSVHMYTYQKIQDYKLYFKHLKYYIQLNINNNNKIHISKT